MGGVLILGAIIYATLYGNPLADWSIEDFAMFIPARHRGEISPKLARPQRAGRRPGRAKPTGRNAIPQCTECTDGWKIADNGKARWKVRCSKCNPKTRRQFRSQVSNDQPESKYQRPTHGHGG